jgi:hypothetical protein
MLKQSILKAIFFAARELKDGNMSTLLFYKLIRSSVSQNFKNINTAFSKLRHNKDRKFNRAITRSHKSR